MNTAKFYAALVLMGVAWGGVFSLAKIAVSTGYQPFGLLVWQMVIGAVLSGIVLAIQGKLNVFHNRGFWLFFWVAILGTVFPNYFSYLAAANIPAGVMVIIVALVPLFSMPIALFLGFEKFSWFRFSGILFGALAVGLLIGPKASLPDSSKVIFVILAVFAPFAYAAEGNFLEWYGSLNLNAVQILFGSSLIGIVVSIPLALGTGQYIDPFHIWGVADYAVFGSTIVNWIAYVGYVWLIGRAGSVFAAQVSYLVAGFGVVWAMVLLNESYSGYIWAALALMMVGLFMVQPRRE